MAAATLAAQRGHRVKLYEGSSEIGGQFNMAMVIPGKEEYQQTIRYYGVMIKKHGVQLHLNHKVTSKELLDNNFDEIIIATGVIPRRVDFPGADHPKILSYAEVLYEKKPVGQRVAIIGAGGIGFDTAEFLTHDQNHVPPSMDIEKYMKEWGVDMDYENRGALAESPKPIPSPRKIYLLKRSIGKHGKGLGKTTGWIHRASLMMKRVEHLSSVTYRKMDDRGLHILVGEEARILEVDNVVICAGQEPLNTLTEELKGAGANVHVIGGAADARQLDAKRAIKQASYLVAEI